MRFTIAEASRMTGIPTGTIRRWISEGRITDGGAPARVAIGEVFELCELLGRAACIHTPSEQS